MYVYLYMYMYIGVFISVHAHRDFYVIIVCNRNGTNRSWTFLQYYREVVAVAKSLATLGLQPFKGVCMLGFNAPEWIFGNIGAIFAGYDLELECSYYIM